MINGDLDYVKDPGNDNRVLYYDAVDSGAPIAIYPTESDGGTTNTIHFNRSIADPALAELFANKDFRIGMSYAINRQEIIDIVNFGQGTPSQAAPVESSPLYNEQLATQYTEYNVDLANEALDKVIPDRDADGYRTLPDGSPLSLVFSVSNDLSYGTTWVQTAELIIGYWDAVGVKATLNSMADAQFIENKENNNLQVTIYTGEGGAGVTAILDPRYYTPMNYFSMFGNAWFYWYTDKSGTGEAVRVEPPQDMQDARAQYEEVLTTAGQDAQIEKMKEVLQTAADNFYVLGIARNAPGYQPYNQRLGNQPASRIDGWLEGVQKITYPEQWYIIQ
jgi:peptide/nickel transport system substrate-binding protein